MAVIYTSCWAVTTTERHSGTLQVKSVFLIDPSVNDPEVEHPTQPKAGLHPQPTGDIHELQPMNPEPLLPPEITGPHSDRPTRSGAESVDIIEDEPPSPGLFEPGTENS